MALSVPLEGMRLLHPMRSLNLAKHLSSWLKKKSPATSWGGDSETNREKGMGVVAWRWGWELGRDRQTELELETEKRGKIINPPYYTRVKKLQV
jgi:hypothetical protein